MKVADVVEALSGFEGEGTFLPLSIPCLMYLSAEGGWYQLIFTCTSDTYELEVVLHHPKDGKEGDPYYYVLPTQEEVEKKDGGSGP